MKKLSIFFSKPINENMYILNIIIYDLYEYIDINWYIL